MAPPFGQVCLMKPAGVYCVAWEVAGERPTGESQATWKTFVGMPIAPWRFSPAT
jgi:hypothetical protein